MGNTDVSRLLGEMWRNAPTAERSKYIEEEAKERKIYKEKIAQWKKEQARREAFSSQKEEQEMREGCSADDNSPHSNDSGSRVARDPQPSMLFTATSSSYDGLPELTSNREYTENLYGRGIGRNTWSTGGDERDDRNRYHSQGYEVPRNTSNDSNHQYGSRHDSYNRHIPYTNEIATNTSFNNDASNSHSQSYHASNSYKFDETQQQIHNYYEYPQQSYSNDARPTTPSVIMHSQTPDEVSSASNRMHNIYENYPQDQARPFHPYSNITESIASEISVSNNASSRYHTLEQPTMIATINTHNTASRYHTTQQSTMTGTIFSQNNSSFSRYHTPEQSTITRTNTGNNNTEAFAWKPYSQRHHRADYSDYTGPSR